MKSLRRLLGIDNPARDAAHRLYVAAVDQARQPAFYASFQVPDTLDGRFDLIILHVHLVVRRLNRVGAAGRDLAQTLFDVLFADMDNNLREIGVSDLSVGKRVKQMGTAYYGRAAAYDAGLAGDDLAGALRRNLYGTVKEDVADRHLSAVAAYMHRVDADLIAQADSDLLAGKIRFPDLQV